MARRLFVTRKRRFVGRREPLPGHGPSGSGFGGGAPRGKRRTGEWRSRHRDRGSAAVAGCGPGLVPLPARRVRQACAPPCSSARGAALSLRGRGAPVRVCGAPPGASRGAAAAGLSRALEAVPEAPSGGFQAASTGWVNARSLPGPASASGACGGACLIARARNRRRRLRMLVCPSPSSGDAAPQGATDPLAVGVVSPGSAPPPEER